MGLGADAQDCFGQTAAPSGNGTFCKQTLPLLCFAAGLPESSHSPRRQKVESNEKIFLCAFFNSAREA